ncbi:unnamed protein product [Dicrocoelium dendriticum]|nr:unnamed protein product [Dicrocoelium dendriticum]
MSRRPFLKDSIFYLAAVAWSASILIRRRIYYADAIGFLVMYILYVFITWAGGTVHRRQMKSTKQYGSGQFWPSSIQWIIDILTSCCSAVYMHCLQNCDFPLYPHLFQRQTTGDTEVQATVKVAYSRSVADAATTKMSDLETCIANGAVVYAKYNPNEFIPSADLPTPVIRVTSTQSPEHAEGDKFMCGSYLPANDTENTITPVPLGTESTYAIHLLTPADHPRMRSSSLRSTDEMPNTRRLSTGAAFNRGPCQRSQSAHRRRASARLSTVGYDLPYMVRWIIANRGMEEKDLSSATGWRRSQRSVHLDLEGVIIQITIPYFQTNIISQIPNLNKPHSKSYLLP